MTKKKTILSTTVSNGYRLNYQPYSVLIITIFSFLLLIWLTELSTFLWNNIFWFLLSFILIEISFLILLRKRILLKLIKQDDIYHLELKQNKKELKIQIEEIKYWWNYGFRPSRKFNRNMFYLWQHNSGNSNLKGRGEENRTNLYLLLKGHTGETVFLKETQSVLAKFPKEWSYKHDDFGYDNPFKTFRIKKMVKLLKEIK